MVAVNFSRKVQMEHGKIKLGLVMVLLLLTILKKMLLLKQIILASLKLLGRGFIKIFSEMILTQKSLDQLKFSKMNFLVSSK
jgi:hypothetical protein